MEDFILLDAIERYVKGEMQPGELEHLEQLRKSNPEIDQLVVEHTFFLKQLNQIGDRKHLKTNLDSIHAELLTNNEIDTTATNAKVVKGFFGKYRKKLAIAATIAALFTIGTLGLKVAYDKGKENNEEYKNLSSQVKKLQENVKEVNKELTNVKVSTAENQKPYIAASTTGTGFVVNENGYIITNYHVVADKASIYVYNERFGDMEAQVLYTDKSNDLAVVKILDTTFKSFKNLPYKLRNDNAGLGQKVFTLGYSHPPVLTYNEGFVSSKMASGSLENKQNFLLTLQVEEGNSGSPIFTNNGEVVGIIAAKEKLVNGYSVGIKTSAIANIVGVLQNDIKAKTSNHKQSLNGLTREEQTKRLNDYIFMIKVK